MTKFIGRISTIYICMCLLVCSFTNAGYAQTSTSDTRWHFLAEPYIMFPYMSGEIGIRRLPSANVDASPVDIFGKLQFAGMLYLEANTNSWAITSDLLYMSLSQDVTPTTILESGKAEAQQLAWEFAGLYRIASILEIGLGGRVNFVQSDLNINRKEIGGGTTPLSGNISNTWIDPYIVMRLHGEFKGKWLYLFRVDAGGAGVGSVFSGQLQGYLGYQFSPLFHLKAGYRLLYMDYEKGSGTDFFRYNMKIYGPTLNFGFNF